VNDEGRAKCAKGRERKKERGKSNIDIFESLD